MKNSNANKRMVNASIDETNFIDDGNLMVFIWAICDLITFQSWRQDAIEESFGCFR